MGGGEVNMWISICDRLPEIGDVVMVYFNSGMYAVSYFCGGINGNKSKWFCPHFGKYTNAYHNCGAILFECITHWQPLPDPPK